MAKIYIYIYILKKEVLDIAGNPNPYLVERISDPLVSWFPSLPFLCFLNLEPFGWQEKVGKRERIHFHVFELPKLHYYFFLLISQLYWPPNGVRV